MMTFDWESLNPYLEAVHTKMGERPYQIKATKFLRSGKGGIIVAKMGSGKTLMALTATVVKRPRKVLILCNVNAYYTWYKELKKWYPPILGEGYTVVSRIGGGKGRSANKGERLKHWQEDSMFYVCSYKSFQTDINEVLKYVKPDVVIMDEWQKSGLLNTGTKMYKLLKEVAPLFSSMMLLSGSRRSKGPQQYWPMLNIFAPKTFKSYWKFVNTYCIVLETSFGNQIIGAQNVEGFKVATSDYIHAIPKKAIQLPPIQRETLVVEMSPAQRKFYLDMEQEMYARDDEGNIVAASTALTKQVRCRQILSVPKVLGLNDWGGGLPAIRDKIDEIGDHHTVIFTPFRAAIPHIVEYLKKEITEDVFFLHGGIDTQEPVENFKRTKGIMACTVKFAESFELETADYAFFLGYEHDPEENYQAEGRLRRISRHNWDTIMMYYIRHQHPLGDLGDTVDDGLLERLNTKKRIIDMTHKVIET